MKNIDVDSDSLSFFKKATLFFLALLIGSASCIWVILYQPWRYIRVAHSDDIILPKDPFSFTGLFIIEAPELELKNHKEELHPKLPPLYVHLPADLPTEVTQYLENRNTYIRQLYDKHYSPGSIEGADFHPEEITSSQPGIFEIIPFLYDGQDCFFALTRNEVTLYDTSLNKIQLIDGKRFGLPIIVSAQFLDRFWSYFSQSGATGGCFYYRAVIYQNEINTHSVLMGCHYDFELDPFNTMKITKASSDPEMKTHILRPYDILVESAHQNPLPRPLELLARLLLWIFFILIIVSLPLFLISLLVLIVQWIILLFKRKKIV